MAEDNHRQESLRARVEILMTRAEADRKQAGKALRRLTLLREKCQHPNATTDCVPWETSLVQVHCPDCHGYWLKENQGG